jgi:hypothetical protein
MRSDKEYAHVIGLIVGGTHHQPVHFDAAEFPGNKENYQRVMEQFNSPASVLLGLGHAVRICVPEDMCDNVHTDNCNIYCTIKGGIPGEKFVVVEQEKAVERLIRKDTGKIYETTKKLFTLESKHGFIFRGDFKHAGAKITTNEISGPAWEKVHSILYPLTCNGKLRNPKMNEYIFRNLCDVPHLDTITRLHVAILPKGEGFQMDENAVGYEVNLGMDNDDDETESEYSSIEEIEFE